MSDIVEILKTLTEAPGISGHEHEVRNIMKDILTPYADTVTTDGLGSLIAHIRKDDDLPNVMLSAHMDEVYGLQRIGYVCLAVGGILLAIGI